MTIRISIKMKRSCGLKGSADDTPAMEGMGKEWTQENIHDALICVVDKMGVKNGQVLYPLRIALSGKAVTPGGGAEIAAVIGRDETIKRIKAAIEKLSNNTKA